MTPEFVHPFWAKVLVGIVSACLSVLIMMAMIVSVVGREHFGRWVRGESFIMLRDQHEAATWRRAPKRRGPLGRLALALRRWLASRRRRHKFR